MNNLFLRQVLRDSVRRLSTNAFSDFKSFVEFPSALARQEVLQRIEEEALRQGVQAYKSLEAKDWLYPPNARNKAARDAVRDVRQFYMDAVEGVAL